MKLFTKSIDAKLFQQYNFGNDLSKQKVVAKIFNPYGRGVWYLLNSDPYDPDYIWAIVDLFEVEIGSVSRYELETMRIPPYNFNLERDLSFEPINADVLYKGVMGGKRYEHGGAVDVVKGKDERFALYPENSSADTMGVVFKKGGKIDDENQDMLDSIATEIQHHSKELLTILKKSPKVEAWVIAKAERCATDLSDITHFLEGKTTKFEYGGSIMNGNDLFTKPFAKGGKTYQKLDEISATVVNDAPTLEKLKKKSKDVGVYEIQEVELVKVGQKEVLNKKIRDAADAVDIFREFFNTEGIKINEAMFVMLLNKANKVIAIYDHSKGSIDGTVADPLLMTATAIKALAKGVIIAHNHPSGNLTPSPADINMSNNLKNGLKLFNIQLLDSLIITENSYYSLAEEGKI